MVKRQRRVDGFLTKEALDYFEKKSKHADMAKYRIKKLRKKIPQYLEEIMKELRMIIEIENDDLSYEIREKLITSMDSEHFQKIIWPLPEKQKENVIKIIFDTLPITSAVVLTEELNKKVSDAPAILKKAKVALQKEKKLVGMTQGANIPSNMSTREYFDFVRPKANAGNIVTEIVKEYLKSDKRKHALTKRKIENRVQEIMKERAFRKIFFTKKQERIIDSISINERSRWPNRIAYFCKMELIEEREGIDFRITDLGKELIKMAVLKRSKFSKLLV